MSLRLLIDFYIKSYRPHPRPPPPYGGGCLRASEAEPLPHPRPLPLKGGECLRASEAEPLPSEPYPYGEGSGVGSVLLLFMFAFGDSTILTAKVAESFVSSAYFTFFLALLNPVKQKGTSLHAADRCPLCGCYACCGLYACCSCIILLKSSKEISFLFSFTMGFRACMSLMSMARSTKSTFSPFFSCSSA